MMVFIMSQPMANDCGWGRPDISRMVTNFTDFECDYQDMRRSLTPFFDEEEDDLPWWVQAGDFDHVPWRAV